VPVFASWVGTVLAFYFGKDNFETAHREVRQTVKYDSNIPAKISSKPAIDIMLDRTKMVVYTIVAGGIAEDGTTIEEIKKKFTNNVTRLPILNADGSVAYMIHESVFDRYLSNPSSAGEYFAMTLDALIKARKDENPPIRFSHNHGFVTVGRDATVGQVKSRMDEHSFVQDVFVTTNGEAHSPMIGWISNTKVAH
jgi:hypothetical protein